jgi:tetratricopeptide (TPR) repeat protein
MPSLRIPCVLCAILLASDAPGAEPGAKWMTRLDEAQRVAAKDGRDLFILFTGTEWCLPCVQFEADVLSRPEFARGAEPFVLVKLEFPKSDDEIPADRRDDLIAWRERYGVRAFPSVFLADAAGRPYAATGHLEIGAAEYVQRLGKLREAKGRRDAALSKSKASTATGAEKARQLDAALSALALEDQGAEQRRELLVRIYRPEIDQILALDPENASGLRDRYRELLDDKEERDRLAAMDVRFAAAMKEHGADAALKLIDDELQRAASAELRKELRGRKRTYLEWGGWYEEALAYTVDMVKDDAYSPQEKRLLRGRIAYNLEKLGRIDEAADTYDALVTGSAGDRAAAWRSLRDKAQLLARAGRLADALGAWDAARRHAEAGTDDWLDTEVFRARLLGRLDRHAEALAGLDSALEADSLTTLTRANILSEKAMILSKVGRRDEVAACTEQADALLRPIEAAGGNASVARFIREKLRLARGDGAEKDKATARD